MRLHKHYETMWEQSLQKFEAGDFQYDSYIDSGQDDRYGLTLLARPSGLVKEEITRVLKEIKAVAPDQYFYPETDLHLTILSIISCYSGFSLEDINPDEYHSTIKNAVSSIPSFDITFKGLTASPSSILIRGYPEGGYLNAMRNRLREAFNTSGLQHSIDARYRLKTAHLTAIRFKQPLSHPGTFIQKIKQFKDHPFGHCSIQELELVGNDWYQQKEKVTPLYKFDMSLQL